MLVLGGNNVTEMFTECQHCLEKSVEGKYGRSIEAVSVLFVQLHLELPSDEHIPCLTLLELIELNCC